MRASDMRVLQAVDPDIERRAEDIALLVGSRSEVIATVLRRLRRRGL